MATIRERQVSFAGGELAPALHGRTDLQRYAIGCKTALNFFVGPHGQLVSRPGTVDLGEICPYSPYDYARIVPFVFDADTALLLAFAHTTLYVFKWNISTGAVDRLSITLTGDVWPYATTYGACDLMKLRFSQVGDTITIVSPDRIQYLLTRTSSDSLSWRLSGFSVAIPEFPYATGIPYVVAIDTSLGSCSGWSWVITKIMRGSDGRVYETLPYRVGTVATWSSNTYKWDANRTLSWFTYSVGDWVFYDDEPTHWYQCIDPVPATSSLAPADDPAHWAEYPSSAHDAFASYAEIPDPLSGWPTIRWGGLPVPSVPVTDEVLATRIYRGVDGAWGLVGQAGGVYFKDIGDSPNWSVQPPAQDFLADYHGSGFGVPLEKPTCVTHYNGRRYFAGSAEQPSTIIGSAVEQWCRFDRVVNATDNDPVSIELAGSRLENILALVPGRSLLVFTDSGVWSVSGSDGGIITPSSVWAYPISRRGCGEIEPLLIGDTLVFLTKKGSIPTALSSSIESDGSTINDLDISTLWRHLFDGHTIVDWCYSADPWSLLWAVRDDGVLLSCAINRAHDLLAWTRHEITGASIENVATVPEGVQDAVYLVARLESGRAHLLRMSDRMEDDLVNYVGLDLAETYDALNRDAGKTVAVPAGAAGETVTVTVTGETVDGEKDERTLRVWNAQGIQVDLELSYTGTPGSYNGTLLSQLADAVSSTTTWALLYESVPVPAHLVGCSDIFVLADARVCGPFDDVSGSVDLGLTARMCIIGRRYYCDFESLPIVEERTKQKVVRSVVVELTGSCGGFVGPSLDADDDWIAAGRTIGRRPLQEVLTRDITDAYNVGAVATDSFRTIVSGSWKDHGRVAFRQELPLPTTLLSVLREVELGG